MHIISEITVPKKKKNKKKKNRFHPNHNRQVAITIIRYSEE